MKKIKYHRYEDLFWEILFAIDIAITIVTVLIILKATVHL